MPQLNLQQLLNGDTIVDLINKINENFNQINTIGGGPQGRRGEQGPPGLPGLRGAIGNSGDNGEDGTKVTLVGYDSNWPSLYSGTPSGPTSANAAILAGYAVGDIWIDNAQGIYYLIEETTPGIYEFVPYPLSPSVLAVGDLWTADTDSNPNLNDADQGLRNKNRYTTISLTSIISSTAVAQGDSASYLEILSTNTNHNPSILGYKRNSYKLSIDNTSDAGTLNSDIERMKKDFSISGIHYGSTNSNSVPLLYLSDSSDTSSTGLLESKSAFGFLLDNFKDGLNPSGGILTLTSENSFISNADQFFIRLSKVGTSKEYYVRGEDGEDGYVRWIDTKNNGSTTTGNNSFWFSVGTQTNPLLNTNPTNPHINQFGLELRRYKTGTDLGGILNFKVLDNTTTTHAMTLSKTGSLLIGNSEPNTLSLSSTINDDANARLVVWQKGNSVIKLRRDATLTNNWTIGFENNDRYTLNYNGSEYFTILSGGNVGMNVANPTARLHIGGNLKITTVNNGVGNFLTWNSLTNEVTSRTPAETLADIGGVGGSGAATQVAWWNSATTITGNNNLWWNNNTGSLGIFTSNPLSNLNVNGNTRIGSEGTAPDKGLYTVGRTDSNVQKRIHTYELLNQAREAETSAWSPQTVLGSIGITRTFDYIAGTATSNATSFNLSDVLGLDAEFVGLTAAPGKILRVTADCVASLRTGSGYSAFYKRITALIRLTTGAPVLLSTNAEGTAGNPNDGSERLDPTDLSNPSQDLDIRFVVTGGDIRIQTRNQNSPKSIRWNFAFTYQVINGGGLDNPYPLIGDLGGI